MIILEVYLSENENKNHPKSGWYKIGEFETVKQAAEIYRASKKTRENAGILFMNDYRIIIDNESILDQV
jgi:hypothetical protein